MDLAEAHILVVRPGALGDAVLTLPVLLALQKANVKRITIMGTPASWAFLSDTLPCQIKVEDFGSSKWLGLFADGALLPADASGLLKTVTRAVVYVGGANDAMARKLAEHGVKSILRMLPPTGERPQSAHAAELLLSVLADAIPKPLRIAALRPFQTLQENPFMNIDGEFSRRILAEHGMMNLDREYVVLHPGSGGRRKCWPGSRYVQVAEALAKRNILTVFFFGPAEEELRANILKNCSPAVQPKEIFCRPLRELLALLERARGYAGNDSGVSHLAAQVCPVSAIFGPTDPRVWVPLGRDVRVLRAPDGSLEGINYQTVVETILR
jgi:heptosyltransferase III